MSDIEHSLLYCGVGFPPNYISIGNLVSLYFYSSSSISRPGFELFYTCNSTIPPTQPPTLTPVQCGGQLNGPSGIVCPQLFFCKQLSLAVNKKELRKWP